MMSDPGGCHRRTAQTLLRTTRPSIVAVRLRCGNRRVVQPVLPTGVRTTLAYPGIHVGLAAIGMLVGAVGLPGAFWPLAGLLLVPLGARRVIARWRARRASPQRCGWRSRRYRASGEPPSTRDTENDNGRRRDHGPCERLAQQHGRKEQAHEGLKKLELAHRGDTAEREAAVPEDETEQH
jgi:hypothetical protein